jgi:hypothetical protein
VVAAVGRYTAKERELISRFLRDMYAIGVDHVGRLAR